MQRLANYCNIMQLFATQSLIFAIFSTDVAQLLQIIATIVQISNKVAPFATIKHIFTIINTIVLTFATICYYVHKLC